MKNANYLFLALVVFLLDQLSKWGVYSYIMQPLVRSRNLAQAEVISLFDWFFKVPELLPYAQLKVAALLNVVMVWNRGVSFGMFNSAIDYTPYVLSSLSLFIIIWFLVLLFRSTSKMQNLAIALIIGGAIGNVFDRLRFGAVMDFIDVHAYGYHWPAFNIADSAIVVGVFVLALYLFFFEKTPGTKKVRA